MDRFTPENRLLITYEGLTDDLIGAEVTKGLNEFLGRARGVTPIASESVACVWRAVVKNEPPPQQAAQIKKLEALAVNVPQGGYESQHRTPEEAVAAARAKAKELSEQQQQQSASDLLDQTLRAVQQKPRQEQRASLEDELAAARERLDYVQQQLLEATQRQVTIEQPPPVGSLEQQLIEAQRQIEEGQQLLAQTRGQGRRRLDLGHMNSRRKGPEVARPYTPEQLDKMMNMLLEVAQKYEREDVRLYHIMMGYYEQIRGERAKLSKDRPEGVMPPGGFY